MKLLRTILATLLGVSTPLTSLAAPHAIAQLGNAPLLGQVSSTPQLQSDVARNSRLFFDAASKLGLSTREYAQFANRIADRKVSYVTIPRHLDAMSWSSGGRVYVLHDVIIPAGTNGWEVDLVEEHQVVAVFVPARCANLSVLRKPLPALARAPVAPHRALVRVAAEHTSPPAAPPAALTAATPAPAAASTVAVSSPAATPGPLASIATSSGPSHRIGWWPLLLVPIIGFLGGHGGHTTMPAVPIIGPPGTSVSGLPIPGPGGVRSIAPTPPPAGCVGPTPRP